jgi:cytochrome bd-type quinol oxidase subunit 1
MWIVIVMGFVRESARAPWTIYGIIPVPGGQSAPTPLSFLTISGVWLVVTVGSLLIFWFTSRVTASHPEKAEEM